MDALSVPAPAMMARMIEVAKKQVARTAVTRVIRLAVPRAVMNPPPAPPPNTDDSLKSWHIALIVLTLLFVALPLLALATLLTRAAVLYPGHVGDYLTYKTTHSQARSRLRFASGTETHILTQSGSPSARPPTTTPQLPLDT